MKNKLKALAALASMNKARAVSALALSVVGVANAAGGVDFSTLTGAVDFSTVGAALLAIAALMMVPKVTSWGAKKVMGFIRG